MEVTDSAPSWTVRAGRTEQDGGEAEAQQQQSERREKFFVPM